MIPALKQMIFENELTAIKNMQDDKGIKIDGEQV
jgi:hypothetical protein